MSPIILQALIFCGVFASIGLIILNVARELPTVGWGGALRAAGFLHLGLAVLSVFALVVLGHDYITQTGCSIVPNTTTTTGAVTTFTWVNTCDGVVLPGVFSTFTQIFTWVVMLEAIVLCIGAPAWLLLRALRGGAP